MVKKLIFASKEWVSPTEGSCRFPLMVLPSAKSNHERHVETPGPCCRRRAVRSGKHGCVADDGGIMTLLPQTMGPDKGSQPVEPTVCIPAETEHAVPAGLASWSFCQFVAGCSLSSLWQRPCGVAHRQCSPSQQNPCHSICREPRPFSRGTER
jgi:hypothetical protein